MEAVPVPILLRLPPEERRRPQLPQELQAADANEHPPARHFVQFYDDESFLLDEVADFIDGALRCGDAGVVIATPAHNADLARRLRGFGLRDGIAQWHRGELITLDAADTLSQFMVDGWPDERRFSEVLGGLVNRASRGGGRGVRAFGEMVALLCADGKHEAAVQVERLWDGLVKQRAFTLFCAYPMSVFANTAHAAAFHDVCASHGHVRPTESFDALSEHSHPGVTIAALQQRAASLEAEIAKRKAAEQTLREREKELADFLENAVEGLHRVGADGTILWANRAEMELLGYSEAEYVGHHIAEFHVDRDEVDSILEKLRRGETLYNHPARLRCKDGSCKHVLIHANAFFENGKLLYSRCFTRDVTEREERRAVERERNSLLMQAPVAAALMTGPDHVFRLANPLYCKVVGRDDIVGKAFLEAFPELADTPLAHVLDAVYRKGEPFVAEEYRVRLDRRSTGMKQEYFFRFNLEPLRSPAGNVYGMMAVAVDITEQVQARRILEKSNADRERLLGELESANQAKDEFLAMLGHELRNPLSPIVTALQLMKMRGDTATSREQGIIGRQVEHLIRLVDDLLDVSKITRGKVQLKVESVEIAEVMMKAVEIASLLFEQRSHRLTIDVPSRGLRWEGDPVRLAQVVANLLTNAARYTDVGGDVRLAASREGDEIVISVKDNGSGIPKEMLSRVFDLFVQGKRMVDRSEGGLGLGLALVKSLVEMHGGTVAAESGGPGMGSEFVIRLPSRTPATTAQPLLPMGAALTAPEQRRVLVVDDNIDAAEMLGQLLSASGHDVKVVHDPAAALSAAENFRSEVAVLDVGLPVMDGYELAALLRAQPGASHCRLIALTGYGQDNDLSRSERAGFEAHLVKPVDTARLLALVAGR